MKKSIKEIIENAINGNGNNAEMIRAVYWYALSLGQEQAESKIRKNLKTLPEHRYHNLQRDAVAHVLQDNPCAVSAPVCPDYAEIGGWDFVPLGVQ